MVNIRRQFESHLPSGSYKLFSKREPDLIFSRIFTIPQNVHRFSVFRGGADYEVVVTFFDALHRGVKKKMDVILNRTLLKNGLTNKDAA